jgi:hypothetical protein
MKHPTIAVLVVALLGVAVLGDVSAQNGSSLIVAGQSIGQTHLGRFGATYLAKLPKPDADDSGMGKYRSVWLSKNQAEQGIAFEFAGRATAGAPCIAIMVHPPGEANLTTPKDVHDILRANGIQP